MLKALEDGSTDILIGTQMIAKGHDFPGVTLVGVISADATLNLPDFRSAERTFQLITQVEWVHVSPTSVRRRGSPMLSRHCNR